LQKKETKYYGLNHYYKETRDQSFPDQQMCWQLVPSVFRMGQTTNQKNKKETLQTSIYDYRQHGYWRIAQLMQSRKQCSNNADEAFYWNDDKNNLRSGGSAQLLQVLFAPVYKDMRANDIPLIHTLYKKLDFDDVKNCQVMGDNMQKMFKSICKRLLYFEKIDQLKLKKLHETRMIECIETMKNEYNLDNPVHKLKEEFQTELKKNSVVFDQSCLEEIERTEFLVLNADDCNLRDMICSKKIKQVFSLSSNDRTKETFFTGEDYSGLSVELNNFLFPGKDQTSMKDDKNFMTFLIDFIRPVNFHALSKKVEYSNFISNTVKRSTITRYNDKILMGCLIADVIADKKECCDIRFCIIKYGVSIEHIPRDMSAENSNSKQYRYEMNITVEIYGNNDSLIKSPYRQRFAKNILRYNYPNQSEFHMCDDSPQTEQFYIDFAQKYTLKERETGIEEKGYTFQVNLEKFVCDYERQKSFFNSTCSFQQDYENAVKNKSDFIVLDDAENEFEGFEMPTETNKTSRRTFSGDDVGGGEGRGDKNEGDENLVLPDFHAAGITNTITALAYVPDTPLPASVPVAVQASSKRSKVSLARQQAANATMEES